MNRDKRERVEQEAIAKATREEKEKRKMGLIATVTGYAAPVFLVISPVLSYTDQAISMYRAKSSAGFSLDIPLIMLVASICRFAFAPFPRDSARSRDANLRANRVFYYPGARYDTALLVQALCNIMVQLVLLKVALDYRPSPSSKGGEAAVPFASAHDGLSGAQRPYNFWQWRSHRPYVSYPLLRRGQFIVLG